MGNEAVRAGQEEEEEEAQREVGKLNAAKRHKRLQILKLMSLSLLDTVAAAEIIL